MTRVYRTLALAVAAVGLCAMPQASGAQQPGAQQPSAQRPQAADPAKAIFEAMAALEKAFDPKVADLYCDSGMVFLILVNPGGGRRSLDIPGRAYKDVIRSNIQMGKATGEYATYTNPTYAREGPNVRITSTRTSVKDKTSNPHTLVVGPCDGGAWKILEERAEMRR